MAPVMRLYSAIVEQKSAQAASAKKPHPDKTGKCRCPMKPTYVAPDRDGGLLNTSVPGDETGLKDPRRVQNPLTGDIYFDISKKTPLLSGDGTGKIRGWVIGSKGNDRGPNNYKVRINWGQQKYMPSPDYGPHKPSKGSVLYHYVFDVKVLYKTDQGRQLPSTMLPGTSVPITPVPSIPVPHDMNLKDRGMSSGWIPDTALRPKKGKKRRLINARLNSTCSCIHRFDAKRSKRKPKKKHHSKTPDQLPNVKHTIVSTSPNLINPYNIGGYTRDGKGNQSHYLSRCPDYLDPSGYVNLCYNLPTYKKGERTLGGLSCDTFLADVNTLFYELISVKPVSIALIDITSKTGKKTGTKQKFVYGAVPYANGKSHKKPAYRYGWIDFLSLKALS
jgi:hypothetical protein